MKKARLKLLSGRHREKGVRYAAGEVFEIEAETDEELARRIEAISRSAGKPRAEVVSMPTEGAPKTEEVARPKVTATVEDVLKDDVKRAKAAHR